MKHFIENEYLRIGVNTLGAELCSLTAKNKHKEFLWQANPEFWAFHSPVLFPVVGNCIQNKILVDGVEYPMKRHGFARYSEFKLIESKSQKLVFSLEYSRESLQIYPYKFSLRVEYILSDNQLEIRFEVVNNDNKPILFSLGAHPAFNVPLNEGETYSDYLIEFEEDEDLKQEFFNDSGFFTGKSKSFALKDRKLGLNQTLFNEGALVFKSLNSRKLILKSLNSPNSVELNFKDFNSLGIWAIPGAPFVCIEPWLGYADSEGDLQEFKYKEGIIKLEQIDTFNAAYSIAIS